MYKLIVIYMNGYDISQATEETAKFDLRVAMESPRTVYAFLYNDKDQLIETHIARANDNG